MLHNNEIMLFFANVNVCNLSEATHVQIFINYLKYGTPIETPLL